MAIQNYNLNKWIIVKKWQLLEILQSTKIWWVPIENIGCDVYNTCDK